MKLALKTAALLLCLGLIGCESKPVPSPRQPTPKPGPSPVNPTEQTVEAEPMPQEPTTPAESAQKPVEPTTSDTSDKPNNAEQATDMVKTESFGKTKEGEKVTLFTVTNKNGLVLKMIDYGATIVSLETPDKEGKLANITLSFPILDGYLQRHPYFGATVGRYGNRIAKGKFKIGDQEYTLATNNGENHLHGGVKGFDAVMWKGETAATKDGAGIRFTRMSPDGEEGYPGNLDVTVTYILTNDNELLIGYEAKTDKPTVINLTNHTYWNLGGAGSGPILNHLMKLNADKYVPVDDGSIPTGELADVEGTPFDFRNAHAIGDKIEELKNTPQGYDHCYVLRGKDGKLTLAAQVYDPGSGRSMEVLTTEPGVQFYTGNYLDGSEAGGGFKQHEAFCLETQHFPDSPNHPEFPSTLLKPGETYKSTTIHKFSVEK